MRIFVLALLATTGACASTHTAADPGTLVTDGVSLPGQSTRSGGLRLNADPVARYDTLWVPLDRIWKVLPAVYGIIEIPIERFNSESNEMGNSGLKVFRKLGEMQMTRALDCGNTQIGPNADSYEILLTVITKLTKTKMDSNVTTIATIVSGRARPVQFQGGYVACKSKGLIESRIAEVLKVNLSPP